VVCQLIFHSASVNMQALDLRFSRWRHGRLPGSCVFQVGGHLRAYCVLLVCMYLGVLAPNFLYLLIFFKWCLIAEERGSTFLESRRRMVGFYTRVLISL
jgi:hypothetical protein